MSDLDQHHGCRSHGHPRRAHVARHRVRLDPHQGLPHRRGPERRARRRQPRVGEPVRRPRLDLLARRRLVRPAGGLRRPRRRGAAAATACEPDDLRRDRRLGDDARLPRLRRRRRAARAVPHLAQHLDGPGRGRAQRALRREHPAALVDRPPAPGGARRRGARPRHRLRHDPRRLRALAAHRPQGARRRRRLRHVPDRRGDARLRRRPASRSTTASSPTARRGSASPSCCPRCSSPASPPAR